ncbi:MAG: endo-1,4-beta-xylanase [Clostridia bacterium]|nr:endo-1,4-beta-xylanase [Clostridia bacterium]
MSGNALQAPSLREAYDHSFLIGAAISGRELMDPGREALLLRHFSSITAENAMKPERILDRAATLERGDPVRTVQNYTFVDRMLSYAEAHGLRVRFHVLVWHNQTPKWFFREGWSDAPDAKDAEPDLLLRRQAAYIADVMDHVNAKYPGLVYAWDVVNEAIEPDQGGENGCRTRSEWYRIAGPRFITAAFREARLHTLPGQKLFYNDYNAYFPQKLDAILHTLRGLCAEGLVDGMGMQSHLELNRMNVALWEQAARAYASLGLTLHVTELDIHCNRSDEAGQKALAQAYRDFFGALLGLRRDGIPLESVTFWGLTDAESWLTGFRREQSWPLLFGGDLQTKPAFDAVIGLPEER